MDALDTAIELVGRLDFMGLVGLTISKPIGREKYLRIAIARAGNAFQASCYFDNKVAHRNFSDAAELVCEIENLLTRYKQFDFRFINEDILILANKAGRVKISRRAALREFIAPAGHNRDKNHILDIGDSLAWLNALGIAGADGKIKAAMQKKFRQINRFLEMIDDVAEGLPKKCRIVDMGCGKGYLTFGLWHYLNRQRGLDATIIGIDTKTDVIANSQKLANRLNFGNLHFEVGDIAKYSPKAAPDMLIALHACDTATDYALAAGILGGSKIILAAPCCQHEALGQLQNPAISPILRHGHFKTALAAIFTDGLRALLLEAAGYKTTVLEFVAPEHTPKNTMLRAIKTRQINPAALAQYREIAAAHNLRPTLADLTQNYFDQLEQNPNL
ncbi:MAG: SAM-dependent methyltransferase [Defluviitaleaceae bacterium]|nr:SAM-dependent methyltransferase [Defluviitaleaceae bacterium]